MDDTNTTPALPELTVPEVLSAPPADVAIEVPATPEAPVDTPVGTPTGDGQATSPKTSAIHDVLTEMEAMVQWASAEVRDTIRNCVNKIRDML
jgi:hypothetical protein